MKVYLCGPINGCTDSECIDWRTEAKQKFSTIDPMDRDYRGRELECINEIVELDKLDIDTCDVLLVNYVKPSVGTSMEIFYAWTLGKPIFVVAPTGIILSPWLIYHSTEILNTFEGAYKKLENL